MQKKASFKSQTENQPYSPAIVVSTVYGLGTTGCKSWTVSLIGLKSWTKQYSAEFGFDRENRGVVQRLARFNQSCFQKLFENWLNSLLGLLTQRVLF